MADIPQSVLDAMKYTLGRLPSGWRSDVFHLIESLERATRERDEARAALEKIVKIQVDVSLSAREAANEMCRLAVDALAATEEKADG